MEEPPRDNHAFLFKLTALSCIGGFLFGYDTGVISGALVLMEDRFNLNDVQEELIVGMTLVGALISSIAVGYFSDIYGRKIVIIVSSIFFMVGSFVLSIFAVNYIALLIGRLIVGFGVG
jgi:MFS family permease